jgi:hypothetical protein
MQQSNVIFGVMLIAFIIFITLKGELAAYIDILKGVGGTAGSGTSTTSSSSNPLGSVKNALTSAAVGTNTSSDIPQNSGNVYQDIFGSNEGMTAQQILQSGQ